MSAAEVRVATLDDVQEIARIQRETWHFAYSHLLGPSALEEVDSADVERQWAAAVEHPSTTTVLALEGTATVGFCVGGLAPEAEIAGSTGNLPPDAAHVALIGTILVEPRWGRRGHGGRMLAHMAGVLRTDGAQRGVIWLAQSDSASLSFFKRAGWSPDGTTRTLDTGEATIREIRVAGDLDLRLAD